MKNILLILTITLLLGCSSAIKKNDDTNASQLEKISKVNEPINYPESTNYWVNIKYLKCIKNGKPVCDCLSDNEFVILYHNEEINTLLIQSSVFHFGLETSAEFDLDEHMSRESDYLIRQIYPLNDSVLIKKNKYLEILYHGEKTVFEKQDMKTLGIPSTPKGIFTYNSDIGQQRNKINSLSILSYPFTKKSDSTELFYTHDEIKKLSDENRMTISCSDDYHYNSLLIKGNPNKYFHLEYVGDYMVIYDENNGRNRGEKLELNNLKRQIFYKTEIE